MVYLVHLSLDSKAYVLFVYQIRKKKKKHMYYYSGSGPFPFKKLTSNFSH